ncbi:MAG TPA: hypothetical protein VM327_07715 [Candidatus Thermoplasmatota archaeon]|nr:hypothetical protein [Candidatus Thermoplasmatota archaeon]
MRPLLALAVLALAMSGCAGADVSNGPGGQSAAGEGSLAYNGASDGTQTDSFESDGSCELHLAANLGSGSVTVTLRTSTGTTVDKTVSGPGQYDGTVGDASGTAGTWTLKAVRSGGFTGQYAAHAEC